MAKRRRMFKAFSRLETENVGHTGAAVALCSITKQQSGMTSAYLDKVRYSFIADVTDTAPEEESGPPLPKNLGYLFWLSTSDTSTSQEFLISASATRGNGGVVSLECKRPIKVDATDSDSGFGRVTLWVETTNPDLFAGDITLRGYVEAYGRWHEIVDA